MMTRGIYIYIYILHLLLTNKYIIKPKGLFGSCFLKLFLRIVFKFIENTILVFFENYSYVFLILLLVFQEFVFSKTKIK